MKALRAPFPWFGGKSRVAAQVWRRFGATRNYVEPFAGSLAVLLGRPSTPQVETVNDIDCYLANFWRALQADPEQVAFYADQPVNEADLHARHRWLIKTGKTRVDKLRTRPDFYDAKVAGWWVWGQCLWIGSGWCKPIGAQHANGTRRSDKWEVRPSLSTAHGRGGVPQSGRGNGAGKPRGVHGIKVYDGRVNAARAARGIHAGVVEKRPAQSGNGHGVGVHRLWEKRPHQDRGGRGVLKSSLAQQLPAISGDQSGAHRGVLRSTIGLYDYLEALAERLRRVRVCCGDWQRVVGPAVTSCIGTTGVFLDPPYAGVDTDERSPVYAHECAKIFHEVVAWAIENGNDPKLRIAVCGYDGHATFPEGWTELAWKAAGGYGRSARGQANRARERIWFSPHCLDAAPLDLELGV